MASSLRISVKATTGSALRSHMPALLPPNKCDLSGHLTVLSSNSSKQVENCTQGMGAWATCVGLGTPNTKPQLCRHLDLIQ